MVISIIFRYHFVDPDPRVEIFEKEVQQKKGAFILKREIESPLHTYSWGWRNFHAESVCFLLFFGNKKLLKALLTCTFIVWLRNFSDLPSCSSESRKRHKLRLQVMFLEVQNRFGGCSAWRQTYLGGTWSERKQ